LARVRIARIECGPLSPAIILVPRLNENEMSGALNLLRRNVREISAVAPMTFRQLPDGTVPTEPEIALAAVRMFCTFHRVRMMPVVDLAYFSDTLPEHLTNLILKHRLSGLILRVRTMPDSEWFGKMEKMLEQTTADMIVVQHEESYWPAAGAAGGKAAVGPEIERLKSLAKADVREIQRGSLLLHPVQDRWQVQALSYPEWTDKIGKKAREGIDPFLVVMPRQFKELLKADGEIKQEFVELALPPAPGAFKPAEPPAGKALEAVKPAGTAEANPPAPEEVKPAEPTDTKAPAPATAKPAGQAEANPPAAEEGKPGEPHADKRGGGGAEPQPPEDTVESVTNAPAAGTESPQSLWQRLRAKIGPESARTNSVSGGIRP